MPLGGKALHHVPRLLEVPGATEVLVPTVIICSSARLVLASFPASVTSIYSYRCFLLSARKQTPSPQILTLGSATAGAQIQLVGRRRKGFCVGTSCPLQEHREPGTTPGSVSIGLQQMVPIWSPNDTKTKIETQYSQEQVQT